MREFDLLRIINSFIYPPRLRSSLRLSFGRFALFLGSVFLGVVFFSAVLFAFFYWKISQLRDIVLQELESTIGFSFAYESIDPHFLSKFKVNNGRIFDFDPKTENQEILLSFSSLELTLDIWTILGFSQEFLTQKIVINDLSIQVDLESLKRGRRFEKLVELLNLEGGSMANKDFFTSFQSHRNFSLYINNLNLNLKFPQLGSFELMTDNISLVLVNGRWDLNGFLNLILNNSHISALSGFSAGFGIKGFGKLNPWQAQLILNIQGFSGDSFQVVDHGYFLSLNGEYLRLLNTTGDNFNLDILYEFDLNQLKGSFAVSNWKLLNLLSLPESANESLKSLLACSLNAKGLIQYTGGELAYSFQAQTESDKSFPDLFQGEIFLNLKGNENWTHIENVTFRSRTGGEISFEGDFSFKDFFPRGKLSLSHFVFQDSQPLSGSLFLGEVETGGYFLHSEGFNIGDFSISGLDAFLRNTGEVINFKGEIEFPYVIPSKIDFVGSYPFDNQLNLEVNVQNFPLDQIYLVFPHSMESESKVIEAILNGLISNLRLKAKLNLSYPEESTVSLLDLSAQYRLKPEQGVFISASGTKSQILLSRFDFVINNFFTKMKGVLDLESGLLLRSNLDVNFNDQKNISLDFLWHAGDKTLDLKSQESISFLLNYSEGLNGLLTMTDFLLPLGQASLTFNQKLIISGERGKDWLIDWEKFDLSVKNSPFVPNWSLSWQALLTKNVLTVKNIVVTDNLSSFRGGGVIQDWLLARNGSFFLTSDSTKESFQLLWNSDEKKFSLDLLGDGFWIEHFQEPRLPIKEGILDLGVSLLFWKKDQDLITSVNLNLRDAYLGELPVKAKSSFALLENHIISSMTHFQIADRVFYLDDLNVNLDDQTYKFKAYLKQENPKNLRLRELSRWQGVGDWTSESEEIDFKISFLVDRIAQKNLKGKVLDFTLTKEGELFSLASQDGVSLEGFYHTATGKVSLNSSGIYPLKMHLEGFALPDLLDLRIENLSFEVEDLPLSIVIPDAFAWHSGLVTGSFFLGGTFDRPEFNGKLSISDARVSTPYVGSLNLDGTPNEYIIGPLEAVVFAAGNTIYLVNTSAQWIGISSIDDFPAIETQIDHDRIGLRGLFTMDGWELDRFRLWVDTLTSRRGIPAAFYQAGIKAQGYVLGNFSLDIQGENIGLRGDLTLNRVDMSLAEEKPKSTRRKIFAEPIMSADFDLKLGRSVRFLWPNEVLPLLRATADTNQKIKLTLNGENGNFSLVGDISIRGGSLIYYSSTFLLTKGRIIFNENQDIFNPFLEIQAETRISDTSGNGGGGFTGTSIFGSSSGSTIRIMLTVNSLLSEMQENATLSSSPSKSQDELRILLGIGDIPFDKISQAQDLGEAGLNLASGLVTNVIFKPIEDFFRNTLNLDYFSLSSDWLKKLSTKWLGETNSTSTENPLEGLGEKKPILNETVSTSRESALETLAEVLDNTRISAGKYIAEGVFFEGGFTLSRGQETYKGRSIKATVDLGFELNASPLVVGWQAGLDLASLGSFDSFSNQISIGWTFSY